MFENFYCELFGNGVVVGPANFTLSGADGAVQFGDVVREIGVWYKDCGFLGVFEIVVGNVRLEDFGFVVAFLCLDTVSNVLGTDGVEFCGSVVGIGSECTLDSFGG